ncbi:MAG: hypothetical protein ACTSP4_12855 [Candidatus Hodarchaeales archaeon]
MTEDKKESKSKYQFDLSDGFGKEDIGGIFVGFWRLIKKLLVIILYPYVWLYRMLQRSSGFIRAKDSDKPLTEAQKNYVESFPMFFILFGLFIGILGGILLAIGASDAIASFLNEFDLDMIINTAVWWISLLLELILWIIGLDSNGIWPATETKVERIGIIDIFREGFVILYNMLLENALLTFIGISVVGFVIVLVVLLISETGIVGKMFSTTSRFYKIIIGTPRAAYDRLNNAFISINNVVAGIVIGRDRLDNRTLAFHKKVVSVSLALGLYTFIGGIFVSATQDVGNQANQILFFIIILIAFGFGVGIVEMWLVARILDSFSRGKYTILEEV